MSNDWDDDEYVSELIWEANERLKEKERTWEQNWRRQAARHWLKQDIIMATVAIGALLTLAAVATTCFVLLLGGDQ